MILSERRLISWNCNANTNMSLIWDQQRCPLSNESFCHIAFLFNLLISFAINSGGNTSAGMLDTKCPCESHLLWVLDLCVVFLFSSGVVPCIAVGWKKGNSDRILKQIWNGKVLWMMQHLRRYSIYSQCRKREKFGKTHSKIARGPQ